MSGLFACAKIKAMANSLKRMRYSIGYQKLLRGSKSMLGQVQQKALRKATFLHAINAKVVTYLIVVPLVLFVADAFVRDTYFDVGFTSDGMAWVGSVAVIEVLIFIVSYIRYKSLLQSDPITSAGQDAERILFEVRDSHGRHATLERIAGDNRVEFLCDFYDIKTLGGLGKFFVLIMFVVLAASFTPRMLVYQQLQQNRTSNYQSAEQAVSEVWLATGSCGSVTMSDDGTSNRYSHYTKCTVYYNDGVEFSANVDFNEAYEIANFGYWIDIDDDISDFPHLDDINTIIQSLVDSLANSSLKTADSKLFLNDFTINQAIIDELAENHYLEDYRKTTSCYSDVADCKIIYQYHYSSNYGNPTNYFYLEMN